MAQKQLRLRRADRCRACGDDLPVGSSQWWDAEARAVTCAACHDGSPVAPAEIPPPTAAPLEAPPVPIAPEIPPTPKVIGDSGASAQREYDRRSARELARKTKAVDDDTEWRTRIKTERPVLGRLAAAVTAKPVMTPESQDTAAWATGAAGERRVAEVLASCTGVYALHDRRIPGSRANIDHIAVAPHGVYVIDAKQYQGAIEARDVGGWLRSDVRLYVNGRDRTKLAEGMARQVEVVQLTLNAESPAVPVHPVLCFVGAAWPRFRRRPLTIRGVTILWPDALTQLLNTAIDAPTYDADAVAATIGRSLPPA